jgi:hypothetical protein
MVTRYDEMLRGSTVHFCLKADTPGQPQLEQPTSLLSVRPA